ncbi:DEAD/DEAH box helicase [Roseinatronobacter sp.]|uniref:DEAD/DEAH box helicase n=1 Tax=Roseinatronobacter sp. TaxID=1945755 RepID=UPI0025DA9E66|nr:DEAD/DEAH box helicase family protein [Roseibaca sp.]
MGLRGYQEEDVSKLRAAVKSGAKSILFEASVGYGKSVVIELLANAYSKAGKRVLVLSNRSAVVEQLAKRASHLNNTTVTTVQAADRKRDLLTQNPADLVLVDEAHMGGGAAQYARVLECSPDALKIGFTGTPKPEVFDRFPAHVKGRDAKWLTKNGYLSPLKYVCPNPIDLSKVKIRQGEYDPADVVEALEKSKIYGRAIDAYKEFANGKPCLGFCVNVKHAETTAEEFRSSGVSCEVLTGKDKKADIERKIDFLKSGGLLLSVDKVSAGFDLPELPVILVLRPTKSAQLWIQILGRVARWFDGKTHGLVLDLVGNAMRLGTLTQERDWKSLETKQETTKTEDGQDLSIRTCDECMFVFEAGPSHCPECGSQLSKDRRISKAESVRLREIEAAEIEAIAQREKEQKKRLGQSIKQMRSWLGHAKAVENMRRRHEKAVRNGDADIAAFAAAELNRVGVDVKS